VPSGLWSVRGHDGSVTERLTPPSLSSREATLTPPSLAREAVIAGLDPAIHVDACNA